MARNPVNPRQDPEAEREVREAALDETIEASFPASDPPSSLPNPADDTALERRRSGHAEADDPRENSPRDPRR